MPLVAYKGLHGDNDFPLHYALFSQLRDRGVLTRVQFALDPVPHMDLAYCRRLLDAFPELVMCASVHWERRMMETMIRTVGRYYRPLSFLGSFDGVIEGPGGRINHTYTKTDVFRHHTRARRRAIVFHSIEADAIVPDSVRESIRSCELVIGRTRASCDVAAKAGAKRVVFSADIVWSSADRIGPSQGGYALALRVPQSGGTADYRNRLLDICRAVSQRGVPVDFVSIEDPVGAAMQARGFGTPLVPDSRIFHGDAMYQPFFAVRDAVVSCRMHTTIMAVMNGNRRILQFQVEEGTNKVRDMFSDLGISSIPCLRINDITLETIGRFLDEPVEVQEAEVQLAIATARERNRAALDALEEWLLSL